MYECLGISVLGFCAYDPSNPSILYFSIGEAIAALSITLIIPQFLKPIYIFRLKNQFIRLSHIYALVFSGTVCVVIASIISNLDIPRTAPLAFPVIWEIFASILFLSAFGALALPVLRVARVRPGAYERFVKSAADYLAHASERDQADFSREVLNNAVVIARTASFLEGMYEPSAFFIFIHRKRINEASYANDLLQIFSEPKFCKTLVELEPWDTAAMLYRISEQSVVSRRLGHFVQEIGRQAILSPSSMLGREVGYTGFHVAPVLGNALFADPFVNRRYTPLEGLRFSGNSHVSENLVDRTNFALKSTLSTVLDRQDYYDNRSLNAMPNIISSIIARLRHQYKCDKSNFDYGAIASASSGLRSLIDDTMKHLDDLGPNKYGHLYNNNATKRDFTALDDISEGFFEALLSFANNFEGYEDLCWTVALDILHRIFSPHSNQPDGMNPLQERVAQKLIYRVKQNMEGYYPPVTGVMLSVLGEYNPSRIDNPKSAYSILKKAFYSEMLKFPDLFEKDPDKAKDYLPVDVRYKARNKKLIKTYSGGREKSTELKFLGIGRVPLEAFRCGRPEGWLPPK